MINSLFKDSHITQSLRHSNFQSLQSREKCREKNNERIREYHSVAQNSNQGIIVKKPAEINFGGFSNAKAAEKATEKVHWIYTSKTVKKFLKMAAESQAVFSAAFSLGLTCILRPAAIMATPSDKKNKDDKKYASAHSIASGVIGYLVSLALFKPISNSMKRIEQNTDKFLKNPKLDYLKPKFDAVKKIENRSSLEAAQKYVSMLPEAIFAAPRATLTIAIIPFILKYGFGLEKKKSGNSKEIGIPIQDYALINFKSTNAQKAKSLQAFMGGNK